MTRDPKLLPPSGAARVMREGGEPRPIALGEWYMVQTEDGPQRIGSNFVKFAFISEERNSSTSLRVHLDEFDAICTPEPNAPFFIKQKIEEHRQRTVLLLDRVKDETARLALESSPQTGGETAAITLASGMGPIEDYKTALIKAKDETLPELFKQIKVSNEAMAGWMQAELLPVQAQLKVHEHQIKRIEGRIFRVELYAGLIERVTQIADGSPAPPDTPVHLFQRRAYMDEECLLDYRVGGMEFKDIAKFDEWMCEPQNRARLLPHPRCVLAMQVRRREKDRNDISLRQWIKIAFDGTREADKLTYLYIRNGDRIFRLATGIDFGDPLFPDQDYTRLDGVLYASVWSGVKDLMTEAEYHATKAANEAEYKAAKREHQRWKIEVNKLQMRDVPKKDWPGEPWHYDRRHELEHHERITPENVHYDDVMQHIAKQLEEHNRLVLVLQGLFDRSPVFHPHPPVKLWTPDGFARALVLVYDSSRALVGGDAPDFEAYRARLNASIKKGSITIGQEVVWEEAEAARENERQARDWRIRNKSEYKRYRPYGNPGPGTLARVVKAGRTRCSFEWKRQRLREQRRRWGPEGPITCAIVVSVAKLLHVDAYTPGDFKQFFADPRTRADYLQWAPYLLEAEEYHAGNRKVGTEPDDAE